MKKSFYFPVPLHFFLIKRILLFFVMIIAITFTAFAQKSKWTRNFGLELGSDFYSGAAGMSTLKATGNPLVASDLKRIYAAEGGFYAEFLQLRQRENSQWGNTVPGFGIKTGVNCKFFRADNSSTGGGEAVGLNYINFPLFFEYCIGYHQGRTAASHTPGTTTYSGSRNYDGSVTVTETTTAGTYNRGGNRTSTGTLLYMGPEIGYLFRSFNYTGYPIVDDNLQKTNIGLVFGITFWMHRVNLDFSYQKGLTSIYSGKNIMIDGFLLKLCFNFKERLYNQNL